MGRDDTVRSAGVTGPAAIPGGPPPAAWRTVALVATVAIVIGIANVLVDGMGGGSAGGEGAAGGAATVPPARAEPVPRTPDEAVDGTRGKAGSTATDSEIIKDETIPTWT